MIIVDIYCRVSTDPQEENTSLDEQEASGREYCREQGLTVGRVHRETASGSDYINRDDLNLMRERYRKGVIKGVVFRNFDRLARQMVHQAILLEEMRQFGVAVHCVKEKLDDTPEGRMLAHFLGMLAEYEWEKIRERTMTGRTNAVKRGEMKALSAHKMRYGYQWEDPDKKDKIILNRKEAVVIRWMSIRYVTGTSASTLVRILKERGIPSPMGKEWSNHTIMTLFSDPRITGKGFKAFHYKEDRYKSHHESVDVPDGTWPAIISMETFRRIQMRAERNKAEASRSSKCPEEFLLRAGYVRCAICKIAMRSCHDDRRPGARYFYRCNEHGMIPSKELDASTWQKVEEMADHLSLIEQAIELASNSDRLMANINAVQASIDKWQAAANSYLADLKVATLNGRTRAVILQQMDEANEMVMRLESEKAQLEDGLVDKESRDIAYQEILDWCKKIKEARGDLSYTRKRDFLDMLGVEVLVYCEKPYRHNSRYEMRVALPDLQKLIPIPSEENEGELVTPTLARRSRRPLCRQ